MNISAPFIGRPRFAMVIAVIMLIAGAVALQQIPVAQFPQLTPPEVQVSASYPGANASVMTDSASRNNAPAGSMRSTPMPLRTSSPATRRYQRR